MNVHSFISNDHKQPCELGGRVSAMDNALNYSDERVNIALDSIFPENLFKNWANCAWSRELASKKQVGAKLSKKGVSLSQQNALGA